MRNKIFHENKISVIKIPFCSSKNFLLKFFKLTGWAGQSFGRLLVLLVGCWLDFFPLYDFLNFFYFFRLYFLSFYDYYFILILYFLFCKLSSRSTHRRQSVAFLGCWEQRRVQCSIQWSTGRITTVNNSAADEESKMSAPSQ